MSHERALLFRKTINVSSMENRSICRPSRPTDRGGERPERHPVDFDGTDAGRPFAFAAEYS